jgi:hypothetical protein
MINGVSISHIVYFHSLIFIFQFFLLSAETCRIKDILSIYYSNLYAKNVKDKTITERNGLRSVTRLVITKI